MDPKQQVQQEVEALKTIQKEVQQNFVARQQLAQQRSENEMVLEELSRLTEDASVYKLIGPALVKQDMVEAKSNVTKRLEYIKSEVERLEKQMKELDGKTSAKQQEIVKLQRAQREAIAAQ